MSRHIIHHQGSPRFDFPVWFALPILVIFIVILVAVGPYLVIAAFSIGVSAGLVYFIKWLSRIPCVFNIKTDLSSLGDKLQRQKRLYANAQTAVNNLAGSSRDWALAELEKLRMSGLGLSADATRLLTVVQGLRTAVAGRVGRMAQEELQAKFQELDQLEAEINAVLNDCEATFK